MKILFNMFGVTIQRMGTYPLETLGMCAQCSKYYFKKKCEEEICLAKISMKIADYVGQYSNKLYYIFDRYVELKRG